MDRASLTQEYKRGREVPAAVAQGMEKRLMPTKALQLSERALDAPPSTPPSRQQLADVLGAMAGWGGRDGLQESAAVQVWSLLQMGIAPHNINVLGGTKAYITVDGRIAHAHKLFEQKGLIFGRIRHVEAPPEDYVLAGGREGKDDPVIKALYEEERIVPLRDSKGDPILNAEGHPYEERIWELRDWEWGSANAGDTVIKPFGQGGAKEQPVEAQFPAKMAKVRATNALLRKVAPVHFPAGVGIQAEQGVVLELDEADYRELPAETETAEVVSPQGGGEQASEAEAQPEDAGAPEELGDDGSEEDGPPPAPEGVDEQTGEVEDAVFQELEIDITQPGSKPRGILTPMDPLYTNLTDGLLTAGFSSESQFTSVKWFQWGDDGGARCFTIMLEAGWDVPQIVEIVQLQDKERTVANS